LIVAKGFFAKYLLKILKKVIPVFNFVLKQIITISKEINLKKIQSFNPIPTLKSSVNRAKIIT
jgi:hypothetical protein